MLLRAVEILLGLGLISLVYLWWARRQGVVKHVEVAGALTPEDLGAARGARATVVQFSTPICAKCPPTRAMLTRVIADYPGIALVEVDAAERLDVARRLDVMRTPTVLVLDANGVVQTRMDGAPTEAQARQAIDELPPAPDFSI